MMWCLLALLALPDEPVKPPELPRGTELAASPGQGPVPPLEPLVLQGVARGAHQVETRGMGVLGGMYLLHRPWTRRLLGR